MAENFNGEVQLNHADKIAKLEEPMRVYPTDTSAIGSFHKELKHINEQPIAVIQKIYDAVEKADSAKGLLPVLELDNSGHLRAKNVGQMLKEHGFNCKDKC